MIIKPIDSTVEGGDGSGSGLLIIVSEFSEFSLEPIMFPGSIAVTVLIA